MSEMNLLIVVDMQNDFIDGTLGFPKALSILPNVVEHIEIAKRNPHEWHLVVTMDTHQEDYLKTREGLALPVEHCLDQTPGWQLHPHIQNALSPLLATSGSPLGEQTYQVIHKTSFGISPESALVLKNTYTDSIKRICICGLVSNICVISNAVILQSAFPEAQIVIDVSATASFSEELNQATLSVLEGLQVQLIKS